VFLLEKIFKIFCEKGCTKLKNMLHYRQLRKRKEEQKMTVRQYFEKAQNTYDDVVFIFDFDENGYEFSNINEALEYAKENNLHDVTWGNSRNSQIVYGGLHF
jgi:hypothetical protein